MPKPFQYRSGSLIYFQGDPADKIYILQNGKVSLVYQDMETGEDIRDPVQPGEFFGVKSALGRYAREENAITLSDTTVMAFTVQEFEAVALANTRIIMKMLKVFSNQMRRVHKQVSKLMAKEEVSPADGLFNLGEYYLKHKRYSQAKHVFSRYLVYYPSGKSAHEAAKNLQTAESAMSRYADGKGPNVAISGGASAEAVPQTSTEDPAELFKEADGFVTQGRYQDAFMKFKLLVDMQASADWSARASFGIGRCMFLMNKFEDSLKFISNMLTQYQKHPNLSDAMLIMGQCNEKLGKKDQAGAFYKKIISMSGGDGSEAAAKAKQALNALGGA